MTDYKTLFYKSQAKIADLQKELEDLTSDLRQHRIKIVRQMRSQIFRQIVQK